MKCRGGCGFNTFWPGGRGMCRTCLDAYRPLLGEPPARLAAGARIWRSGAPPAVKAKHFCDPPIAKAAAAQVECTYCHDPPAPQETEVERRVRQRLATPELLAAAAVAPGEVLHAQLGVQRPVTASLLQRAEEFEQQLLAEGWPASEARERARAAYRVDRVPASLPKSAALKLARELTRRANAPARHEPQLSAETRQALLLETATSRLD